jgi:hypothetical protein
MAAGPLPVADAFEQTQQALLRRKYDEAARLVAPLTQHWRALPRDQAARLFYFVARVVQGGQDQVPGGTTAVDLRSALQDWHTSVDNPKEDYSLLRSLPLGAAPHLSLARGITYLVSGQDYDRAQACFERAFASPNLISEEDAIVALENLSRARRFQAKYSGALEAVRDAFELIDTVEARAAKPDVWNPTRADLKTAEAWIEFAGFGETARALTLLSEAKALDQSPLAHAHALSVELRIARRQGSLTGKKGAIAKGEEADRLYCQAQYKDHPTRARLLLNLCFAKILEAARIAPENGAGAVTLRREAQTDLNTARGIFQKGEQTPQRSRGIGMCDLYAAELMMDDASPLDPASLAPAALREEEEGFTLARTSIEKVLEPVFDGHSFHSVERELERAQGAGPVSPDGAGHDSLLLSRGLILLCVYCWRRSSRLGDREKAYASIAALPNQAQQQRMENERAERIELAHLAITAGDYAVRFGRILQSRRLLARATTWNAAGELLGAGVTASPSARWDHLHRADVLLSEARANIVPTVDDYVFEDFQEIRTALATAGIWQFQRIGERFLERLDKGETMNLDLLQSELAEALVAPIIARNSGQMAKAAGVLGTTSRRLIGKLKRLKLRVVRGRRDLQPLVTSPAAPSTSRTKRAPRGARSKK